MRDYSYDGEYNEKVIGTVNVEIKKGIGEVKINIELLKIHTSRNIYSSGPKICSSI